MQKGLLLGEMRRCCCFKVGVLVVCLLLACLLACLLTVFCWGVCCCSQAGLFGDLS